MSFVSSILLAPYTFCLLPVVRIGFTGFRQPKRAGAPPESLGNCLSITLISDKKALSDF
jgi:hypothetical protein